MTEVCWSCKNKPASHLAEIPVCGESCSNRIGYRPPHSVGNIEKLTLENTDYRRVIDTSQQSQLVLMSVEPEEGIPEEIHEHTTQFVRVESGLGYVLLDGMQHDLGKYQNDFVLVHAGTRHEFVVVGTEPLKLYSIYSPPHHPRGLIEKRMGIK